MPDSPRPRSPGAERDAYDRGVRAAHIDGTLEEHEKRFRAINGSIERGANNMDALRRVVEGLRDQVDALSAQLLATGAVEKERNRQLERANNQQIGGRQFWLGVAAIIVTLVAAMLSHGGVFK